jgi:D-alanyl-D-alanine dipeptidase
LKNYYKNRIIVIIVVISVFSAVSCSGRTASEKTGSSISSSLPSSQASSAATDSAASVASPEVIDGFVRVTDIDSSFVIDLKYATADNFTHQKVYPTDVCVLRLETAEKLAKANAEFEKSGYRIKIWDAFRPVSVQKIFWSIEPDDRFVANPATGGSVHNRGCAVDVTLVDQSGQELVMPSGFDDFTKKAYRSNPDMSAQAKADLDLLTRVMTENGFLTITTEWWHFEDSDRDNYQNADLDLALFE